MIIGPFREDGQFHLIFVYNAYDYSIISADYDFVLCEIVV